MCHESCHEFAHFPVYEGFICLERPTDVFLRLRRVFGLLMQEETHPAREHSQENPPLMAKSCSAHVTGSPSGKGGIEIKGKLKSQPARGYGSGGRESPVTRPGESCFPLLVGAGKE